MKKGKSPEPQAELPVGQENPAAVNPAEQPELVSGGDSSTAADQLQELKNSLEAKENDLAALADKYLRLAAEYDNFRRRSQKEKESLYTDSVIMVIKEWLPVLDNLDRAEMAASQYKHEDARKIAEGIAMIQRQAEQALGRLGVSKIECCGKPFDPELHEAVMHVEDDSVEASTVVAELQTGYRRDDRVIRHSMVKVAN
jgi:molecular chaperone GrpE